MGLGVIDTVFKALAQIIATTELTDFLYHGD